MDEHIWKAWSIRGIGCLMVLAGLATSDALAQSDGEPASFAPLVALPAAPLPDIPPAWRPAETFGQSVVDESADGGDSNPGESSIDEPFERPFFGDVQLEDQAPPFPYHFTFIPRFLVGPVHGYTQIPAGGQPGTTSRQRPRLGELGIHDALIPDLELSVARGPHEVYAGIQIIRFTGTQTLRQVLTSHGLSFPKGARLRSDENLDWYRLGYRYSIPLFPNDDGVPRLTITPQADLVWWTFEYRLIKARANDPTTGKPQANIEAKRSFDHFTGRLGANVEWRPYGGPFSIDAAAMFSPQISGDVYIATQELTGHYRLLETSHYGMDVSAGMVFEQMDFRDDQKSSNHVKAIFGPLFVIGMNVRF